MLAPDVMESAERRIGQTVCGKWHLDRVIGIGGMAAVYEATHRNRNRVAIKMLHPALSLEDGTRQRFLREGYVANTIRHTGAVQVLDDDVTDDGVAFLVMELLRGESVEERMYRRGGALEVQETLEIADQLLDVLGAAHDQKVIHRDIKPDNIFLTDSGDVKVLDFGIARLHQGDRGMTKVGSFMGTPAFCAQEQARGRWDSVDHRTDLYSVGATIFTCVTGEHVHQAETSSEQLALAISSKARSLAEALPGVPRDLVQLVDTALSYNKEDRYQSARAMRAAVTRVMAGLPASTKLSQIPPSTPTLGEGEMYPESLTPPLLFRSGPSGRVTLGLLAVGVLAVLLFLASYEAPVAGPSVTNERETSPSDDKASVVTVPTPDDAPSSDSDAAAPVSQEAGLKSEPSEVDSGESVPPPAEGKGGTSKEAIPERRPLKQDRSKEDPSLDSDEAMFGKRY